MITKKKIANLLKKRIVVLDGATGTQLQKLGLPPGACPEQWCIENPLLLKRVHVDYQKAGADIIYTSTFGANRLKLNQYNITDIQGVNKSLAIIARKAVGRKAFVAGDIGPTGHFVKPFGALDFEEAVKIYKEQVNGLVAGGVDIFAIETMMDIQEARAALIAVKEITDSFVIVTMTFEKDGHTLNGTDPLSALITLQSLGADAVGCNCSTGPEDMLEFIRAMKPYAKVPLVAKPNAGMPRLIGGVSSFSMKPKEFASFGRAFAQAGVNMIGGCCGSTPEHIRALIKKVVKKERPILPVRESISALSSARKSKIIERNKPLITVGERINPTGKKELQQELLKAQFSLLRQMAKDQEREGADLLDINIGVPGINEEQTIKEAIGILSTITDLPLVIDSSNCKTIETALRLYPGRLLINSISGESKKLKKLLALAAKYGAMFVALPLTEKEIPQTSKKRQEIIRGIFRQAEKFGFTKDDIIVDGLAFSVSSHCRAAEETLDLIAWCSQEFKCNTILGLSNVSFGLPQRKWVNAAFLAMAELKGLSMAIVNTASEELKNIKMASDVLVGKDKFAATFVAYNTRLPYLDKVKKEDKNITLEQRIHKAVIEGNRDNIDGLIKEALHKRTGALIIVNKIIIPAIAKVGELFSKKEYFLPQLIASAEAAKKAFHILEPYLKKDKRKKMQKAVIILATVKGDIHDIGKNIVALMLRNHGFQVVDLGKDVSAARIVNAAKSHKADIVGLSALMTTTMVNMKDVIALAQKQGLQCKFIVGGAVLTQSFAHSLGAAYGKDGVEAVRKVEKLTK